MEKVVEKGALSLFPDLVEAPEISRFMLKSCRRGALGGVV